MSFIGCTDQPANTDKFKIKNYIDGLGKFITVCQTPITIAVQGDWGSGKTSVMKMVINGLDSKRVLAVEFNAWQFSQFANEETLAFSLINTIIDKIGATGNEEQNKLGESLLKKMGFAATVVGRAAANIVGERVAGGANMEAINDGINSLKESMDTIAKLKDKFQEYVNDAVQRLRVERLLIFVDDLDRLQPVRAVELLEALKIFLDCEKCVFVLAIDYNVVVKGVKSKYGEDITANKGRNFFDKIIQVPFKMPVAQYDISGFVSETLNDLAKLKCTTQEVENFVALINSSISCNPRSMKRLFNSYLLLLQVMEGELKDGDEQSKKNLFAILCMQQHLESFYNFVVTNVVASNDEKSDDIINADFFNTLAASDDPEAFLMDVEFVFQSADVYEFANEANQILAFVKCFNRVISDDASETVSEDCMRRIRGLLKTSSITATKTPAASATVKKNRSFDYKGQTYKPGGAKMNMGKFATILIKDYAAETKISADGLMKLVNSKNFCGPAYKKAGLSPICERNHPALTNYEKLAEGYINEPEAILSVDDKELLLYRWWPHENINKLIGALGYEDRVKRL